MLLRRILTIPAYLALTALFTALAPLLLIGAWIIRVFPACRGAVPTVGLMLGYLWCETIGILASCYLWLRHRDHEEFLAANYRLQYWWATTLKRIMERLFGVTFEVTGTEALDGEGAIMFPRHVSLADTFIPMVFYAIPKAIRLRYVLKRELLLDPCLDIVGNRLPNFFVDRDGQDTERAVAGVGALTADMQADDGLLLYPEGTRHSASKVAALAKRWANRPELLAQLERWKNVLPPRIGGTLAALESNPGKDLIFCAHVGFEGSTHFRNLINGAWRGARIRIHFWRIPFADIPRSVAARKDAFFAEWDKVNRWVSLHLEDTAGSMR